MANDPALSRRLDFIKLDKDGQDAVRSLKPLVEKHLPAALDGFYQRLQRYPEVSRFFSGGEHVSRAKGAQLRHWSNISSANYGDEYVRSVNIIGQTHARIGLEPRWYIGGYALITEQLLQAVVASLWPKNPLGRKSAKASEVGKALGALTKAVFLDMDIAISVYIEASEAERVRLEKERALIERQQAYAFAALSRGLAGLAQADLTTRITEELASGYNSLKSNFNSTMASLEETMQAISISAREVNAAASEIQMATTDLSQRTEEQASSLEQTSAAMEQMAGTVRKNAENAQEANDYARKTHTIAHRGSEVVSKTIEAMSQIQDSSRKISDIIGVIDEIAFQTNILALNAAVEAARAGTAGQGFAVVASEVRRLAQRSSQAAKDIKELINHSSNQVKGGVDLVNQAGSSLTEIVESIKQVATIIADIASASAEQAIGVDEVNKALGQMDQVTQQNSALVEESAATAAGLDQQSGALHSQVGGFKVTPKSTGGAQKLAGESVRPAPMRRAG